MANVGAIATLGIEVENRGIVMSRAELEKLASTGTVAGEKIRAALAGVTPIAQTVADRARQANDAFTQWEQSSGRVNVVTAAIQRMQVEIEKVRANAMASQVALNDPFQKAEQNINRVTAALERNRAALQRMQAAGMASQIAQRDPFQQPGAFQTANAASPAAVNPAIERANGNLRAFSVLTREGANALGLLGRQGFMVANALHIAVEEFERMRVTQAANGAAAGATVSRWTTLRTAIASVNPLVLAAIAGMAAYAITSAIVRKRIDEETEAIERQAEMLAFMNKVRSERQNAFRDAAAEQRDASRQLAAFRRGGEEALQLEVDRQRALAETRAQYSALRGAAINLTEEDEKRNGTFQRLLNLQEGAIANERELANLRKAGQAQLAADQMHVAALADYAELMGRLTPLERARSARGAEYMAFLKAAGLDEAQRNQKLKEFMVLLEQVDKLTEKQRREGIAAQLVLTQRQLAIQTRDAWLDAFGAIAQGGTQTFDVLLQLAMQLADQAHAAAVAVAAANNAASGAKAGDAGFQTADASLAPIIAVIGSVVGSIFSFAQRADEAHDRWVRVMEQWHESLDEFAERFDRSRTPLQDTLDDIADFYEQRLRDLEPLRHRVLGTGMREFNDAVAELDETVRRATEAAKQAAEAERVRLVQDLNAELARARGNDALAIQIERQQRLNDAKTKEEQVLLKQIFRAEDAARAMEKLTDNIGDLKRVVDSIQEFRNQLLLGPQSPLSPVQQLAEARRQFETMAALALGGDRSAAASLPSSVQAFLDLSREVNASGGRAVADWQRVQDILEQVQGRFAGELSVEEQSLAELKKQTKDITDRLDRGNEQRDASIAVLGAGFTRLIAQGAAVEARLAELAASVERGGELGET